MSGRTRIFTVEGFGATAESATRWLAPLSDCLRFPGVDIVPTAWNLISPAMLEKDAGIYDRQAAIAHSYGVAGLVRALGEWDGVMDVVFALDGVPRWAWGQGAGWVAPRNAGVIMHWYQRNLGPMGEPFTMPKFAPGETRGLQGLYQMNVSSRGVLHTTLPYLEEIYSAIRSVVRPLAE